MLAAHGPRRDVLGLDCVVVGAGLAAALRFKEARLQARARASVIDGSSRNIVR
jgi:hypothetical protein